MHLQKIQPLKNDLLQAVIETPRGGVHKYDYNHELDLFELNKTLPVGASFPFDFGFVPNTLGEDGDPLDVLVLLEGKTYPGCLVSCRLLAVLEAEETERDGKKMRNDRIVAVADCSLLYANITALSDLNKNIENGIAAFFVNYNRQAGKLFTPLGWAGPQRARALIEAGMVKAKT